MRRIIFFFTLLICIFSSSPALAQSQVFTPQTLSQYDGRDGHPAYFGYKGNVYDVSASKLWKLGEHFGVHAGFDLTGKMEGAPHGDEVLAQFPVVGRYIADSVQPTANSEENIPTLVTNTQNLPPTTSSQPWYAAPIRIAGISILGWTGIVLSILFILNFMTCFALPWSKLPLPWKGKRPGPDALDKTPVHLNFASIHKYFAWATVLFGILHGVLGLLQLFGFFL